MKRIGAFFTAILLILMVVLLITSLVIRSSTTNDSNKSQGRLEINGKPVRKAEISIYKVESRDCANLPLTRVLQALGFDLEWVNKDTVHFILDGKEYSLSLEELRLNEIGGIFNYLDCPPGSYTYFCERQGDEVYVDDVTLEVAFIEIGVPIRISIDYDDQRVDIYTMG